MTCNIRQINAPKLSKKLLLLLLLASVAVSTNASADNENSAGGEIRISRSVSLAQPVAPGNTIVDAALEKTESRVDSPLSSKPRQDGGGNSLRSLFSYSYWIYDLFASLEYDFDGDGFYQRLSLNFQPDLDIGDGEIYADIYISYENSQWDYLTSTSDYYVSAGLSNDYFRITTQLDSGYPTGYYDILIELHDSHSGRLVASYGPADSLALDDLPLEDGYRDTAGRGTHTDFYVAGGGAYGGTALLMLASLALIRRRLRRSR